MLYNYYISYAHEDGFGDQEMQTHKKINTFDEIRKHRDFISRIIGKNVTIINYILVSEEE